MSNFLIIAGIVLLPASGTAVATTTQTYPSFDVSTLVAAPFDFSGGFAIPAFSF